MAAPVKETWAVFTDAVAFQRVGCTGDELIDDEAVEPGRDQHEPPARVAASEHFRRRGRARWA